MALKRHSKFLKGSGLELHYEMQFSVVGVLYLSRYTVGVFYSCSRLGYHTIFQHDQILISSTILSRSPSRLVMPTAAFLLRQFAAITCYMIVSYASPHDLHVLFCILLLASFSLQLLLTVFQWSLNDSKFGCLFFSLKAPEI